MAIHHSCDGCAAQIIGHREQEGFVIKREYCLACHETVIEYLRAVDQLHDHVAQLWWEGLSGIRAEYRERLLQLPDDVIQEITEERTNADIAVDS